MEAPMTSCFFCRVRLPPPPSFFFQPRVQTSKYLHLTQKPNTGHSSQAEAGQTRRVPARNATLGMKRSTAAGADAVGTGAPTEAAAVVVVMVVVVSA